MNTYSMGMFQYGGFTLGPQLPFEVGKIIFVDPSAGDDLQLGATLTTPVRTLSRALALATENQNDVVYLIGGTDAEQTETLVWSKDGTHLIGMCSPGLVGKNARITQAASVANLATVFHVTASNCCIANISIFQQVDNNTVVPKTVIAEGFGNQFLNCEMSGLNDSSMDVSGARSLVLGAITNTIFRGCYIGSNVIAQSASQAVIEISSEIATMVVFEDCYVVMKSADVDNNFVFTLAGSEGSDTGLVFFKNCSFINDNVSSIMNYALGVPFVVDSHLILHNPYVVGATDSVASGTDGVAILGFGTPAKKMGIGVSAP